MCAKFCLPDLLPVITKMINLSLETAIVADVHKEALLISLLKKVNLTLHTYICLLTTSPKGLFSANYKEKDKNKNIYKLFKVTITNL